MSTSSSQEPLRLSADDLYSPRVDAFLDEQAVLSRALPEAEPQPFIVRMFYSSYFYLSLAERAGGLCGLDDPRALLRRQCGGTVQSFSGPRC